MEDITPIYYNDKCIWIAANANTLIEQECLTNAWVLRNADEDSIENAYLQFISSSFDNLILEGNTEDNFDIFSENFEEIDAAGGVVWNENEELLMIHRLGKWDLPKGKLDLGEEMAMCAVREVEEETGLDDICLSGILKSTFHIYSIEGMPVLKRTEWYEMSAPVQSLTPQAEEDILQAIWVPRKEVPTYLENTYPAIRSLLKEFILRT